MLADKNDELKDLQLVVTMIGWFESLYKKLQDFNIFQNIFLWTRKMYNFQLSVFEL